MAAEIEAAPRFTPRSQPAAVALDQVQHVLVVMSGKGGVGKSTVAVNLAAAFAQQGLSVGLADLDITNPNVPRMTGLSDFHFTGVGPFEPPQVAGIFVASTQFFSPPGKALIWRGPMKQKMIVQLLSRVLWPDLDVLVIDLPPGTSDEPLSVAELIPKRAGTVIVTTPQRVAVDDAARSVAFAQRVNLPIVGLVENMSGFRCSCGREHALFGTGGGKELAGASGVRLLGSVPIDPRLMRASDDGKPLILADPDAPASKAFQAIAEKIRAHWAAVSQ